MVVVVVVGLSVDVDDDGHYLERPVETYHTSMARCYFNHISHADEETDEDAEGREKVDVWMLLSSALMLMMMVITPIGRQKHTNCIFYTLSLPQSMSVCERTLVLDDGHYHERPVKFDLLRWLDVTSIV